MKETIERYCARQTPATARSYHWFLTRLAVFLEGKEIPAEHITPDQIEEFLNSRPTWNHATRRLARCAIRAFYKWWRGTAHPAAQIHLKRLRRRPQRVLKPAEVLRLLTALSGSGVRGTPGAARRAQANARNLAMICLMLDTGLRESEICRLEVQYLDLAGRSLFVIVKGGKWGKAVFSQITADYLTDWLEDRARLAARYHSAAGEVFIGFNSGRRLSAAGLRKLFQRISAQTGVPVNPHALRRTFATLATKAGAPTRVLMAAGRWSNISEIETYTRTIEAADFDPWFPVEFLAGSNPPRSHR